LNQNGGLNDLTPMEFKEQWLMHKKENKALQGAHSSDPMIFDQ